MTQAWPIVDPIVNDVFEGLTDLQIMTKHSINWSSDLVKIFERLVTLGIVEEGEFIKRFNRGPLMDISLEATHRDNRQVARNRLFGKVEVRNTTQGGNLITGELQDISEYGLMISPIQASKGNVFRFTIDPIHLEDVQPIDILTECRWTDGVRAGFKIVNILPSHMRELKKFIKLFTFEAL